MTRRVLLLAVPLAVVGETRSPLELANQFATLYNEWVGIKRVPGTINAHEILLWHDLQEAWRVLNKVIHYD